MVKKLLAILAMACTACLLAPSIAFAALPSADTGWYDPAASDYTLTDSGDLVGFAQLVNNGTDFDGKTVALAPGTTFNLLNGVWTPIGTPEHPFQGTFEGNQATIDNFTVEPTFDSYLGLFGYIGSDGKVSNTKIGQNASIAVSRASSSASVIHHVGMIAGFCAGDIDGCTNAGSITIESAVLQTKENPQVIRSVGGIAGECIGDMAGCTNSGEIAIKATSDPIADSDSSVLVRYVGGIVGVLGDETMIGSPDAPIATDPARHGALSGCTNLAKIDIDTPSESGKDRFGETTFARSEAVGGIVGYSQGSIRDCENGLAVAAGSVSDRGYLRAGHATSLGGIVGSLRGIANSENVANAVKSDDGMAGQGNDPIEVSNCIDYGDIYGLNAVGGIVGHAGTYTSVTACLTMNKATVIGSNPVDTYVVATRWNKPAPAGIVGGGSGDVSFCANFATVMSGSWVDESMRTYNTAGGYYCAGIVGMLSYFSTYDEDTQVVKRTSPFPEVYSCYNAGSILAQAGMRQRGIVGENGGFCHDNILLAGTVDNDNIVYGDEPGETEASGATSNNVVMKRAELLELPAVAHLNAPCESTGWQHFWAPSLNRGAVLDNKGYPVLDFTLADAGITPVDLSDASASCDSNAHFTGTESVPDLRVVLDGKTLVQNAEYRVIPESGAIEVAENPAYSATIVGIGGYTGQISAVAYGIDKGYLNLSTVNVENAKFNYERQMPTADDVTVLTAGGTLIDPAEYEILPQVTNSRGKVVEPIEVGTYTVSVRVHEGSAHFVMDSDSTPDADRVDTASGTFRINAANMMRDVDYKGVTITIGGVTYPWVSSTDEADIDYPSTVIPYTGSPITPQVSSLSFNGHTLREGTDYRVVYGNPNPENGDTTSHDANNTGVAGGTGIGCVTVRYVTGSNFTNYVNMFFEITDKDNSYERMYRLYNTQTGEHLYTTDMNEYRQQSAKVEWTGEGPQCWMPTRESRMAKESIIRLYSPSTGEHHYTSATNSEEIRVLTQERGWKSEGVICYAPLEDGFRDIAMYRLYNPNRPSYSQHLFTTDEHEWKTLVSKGTGWTYEGIAWYGVDVSEPLVAARVSSLG